jgi:hypothetical protein
MDQGKQTITKAGLRVHHVRIGLAQGALQQSSTCTILLQADSKTPPILLKIISARITTMGTAAVRRLDGF